MQETQVANELVVSYVVAIDIWYMACCSFIFMALLELAAALIYCQKINDEKDESVKPDNISIDGSTASTTVDTIVHVESNETIEEAEPQTPTRLTPAMAFKLKNRKQSLPASMFSFKRQSHDFGHKSSHHHHHHHHDRHSAHLSHTVKQLLNHIYGEIDWRKAPGDRNKIDYCARIIFPASFGIFVICYFFVLGTR